MLSLYLSGLLAKKQDIDIIYCHFGHNGRLMALLKKIGIIKKSKIITVFHGFEISQKKFLKTGYYDLLFQTGDLMLPVSYTWKKRLIDLGCDERKIMVHRMGINLDKFVLIENTSKNYIIKLLTIARLTEKKGIEYAIKAVYRLIYELKTPLHIIYTIIGDGELKDELAALVIKLGLQNIIHFQGMIDQSEVIVYMQKSNIFLLPSITGKNGDMEGIPVVLMEAMACGLPVISTFHSGIPELVQNGKAGFLVPERDAYNLACKLHYLINNTHLWKEIGRNSRKIIETEYNNRKLNNELKEIFENMVHSEGPVSE
jgi:colanic acid/amylovoran biosynthesis glycosyltransferase